MRIPEPRIPHAEPRAPSYALVWWDPNTLKLGAEVKFGLRQEELIGKDAPREIVQADLKAYEDWKTKRDGAIEHGSSPSLVVHTATERAAALVRGEGGVAADQEPGTEHAPGTRHEALTPSLSSNCPVTSTVRPDRATARSCTPYSRPYLLTPIMTA